ncbi:MAG: LptA/OstA family protein [Pseudomonadota bacterium]
MKTLTAVMLCVLSFCAAQAALAQVGIGFGGVAHDGSQPVEVTADSLTVDRENGNAVFAGNVLIIQGDLRMTAGEVEIIYSGDDIDRVVASGGVLVTRGDDAAEGSEAEYTVTDANLTLSGDVLVTQGPTAIAGDRMVVDLATGSGTVSGRVRTTLQGQDQ